MVKVRKNRKNSNKMKIVNAVKSIAPILFILYIVFLGYSRIALSKGAASTTQTSTGGGKKNNDEGSSSSSSGGTKSLRSLISSKNGSDSNQESLGTIGFAVTVTGCGSDPITEGAAVLKHSIHLASIHGNLGGKYDYQMYALYHPNAKSCAKPLEHLGYELLEKETPVAVKDIEGEFLRSKIQANGCCGEKELIKLEAYTLVQHPVVVHLDLDVLVLQPLDSLFDMMLDDSGAPVMTNSHIELMWREKPIPSKINAFFTRDYNMVGAKKKYKPAQGGFLVLRPNMDVYNEFISIIKKGDFQKNKGWGGVLGVFYGSMTFQGLIPYYYDVLHPGEAIELNRCVYNQMCDNPRTGKTVNDIVSGDCRTGEINDCEDCRSRPIEDVITTHYTLCQKPWLCLPHTQDMIQHRLCRKLHHEWFRIRSDMEKSWGRNGLGPGDYDQDHFYGYCTARNKYHRIDQPYGSSAVIEKKE